MTFSPASSFPMGLPILQRLCRLNYEREERERARRESETYKLPQEQLAVAGSDVHACCTGDHPRGLEERTEWAKACLELGGIKDGDRLGLQLGLMCIKPLRVRRVGP
jgi:hypothetical protein